MGWAKTPQGVPVYQDEKGLVHLKDFEGKVQTVKPEEATKLLSDKLSGFSAATAEDLSGAGKEKPSTLGAVGRGLVAGTIGGALAGPKLVTALGTGAINALGGDVQDPLAPLSGRRFLEDMAAVTAHFTGGESEVAGRQEREATLASQAEHPIAFGGAELAGNVIGAGGLAAGARGLAGGAAGALGLTGRAAGIATNVGAGVLEGGALGADAASEQAWVKNAPLTSQQSLAAIGLGALFGGGISVAAAGASRLPAVTRLLRRGEAVEGLEGAAATEGAAAEPRALMAAEEKAAPAAIDAVDESVVQKGNGWRSGLGEYANKKAVNEISAGQKGALKRLGGGEFPSEAKVQETGELLHDMKIVGPLSSASDQLEVAQEQVAAQNAIFQKIHASLSKDAGYVEGTNLLNSLDDFASKVETEGKLGGSPEARNAANVIRERVDSMIRDKAEAGILTHQDVHNFRKYLDTIGFGTGHAEHIEEAAIGARRIVSDVLADEIKKASPELARDWELVNKRYAAATWAAQTLESRVAGHNVSGAFGLKDIMAGGAFAMSHPVAGIPAAIASKLLRERGGSTFAYVAKRIANDAVDVSAAPAVATPTARKLSALVAQSTEHVESSVGKFLGGGRPSPIARAVRAAPSLLSRMRSTDLNEARDAYSDHVREVQTVASSPDVAAARLQGITGSTVPLYAPGLHGEMVATANRAAQYLSANAPAPAQDPNSITPQVKTPPPVSMADISKYRARAEGVEDPLSLLDDLNSVTGVRPEKVEAVKTVHPELFEQIRQSVFTHLAERKVPLSYSQAVRMDMALDAGGTIAPSMNPKNLAVMQMAAAGIAKSQMKPSGGAAPNVSGMLRTRSQQIAGGPQ